MSLLPNRYPFHLLSWQTPGLRWEDKEYRDPRSDAKTVYPEVRAWHGDDRFGCLSYLSFWVKNSTSGERKSSRQCETDPRSGRFDLAEACRDRLLAQRWCSQSKTAFVPCGRTPLKPSRYGKRNSGTRNEAHFAAICQTLGWARGKVHDCSE